jgi:hypothetical protein
VPDELTAAVLVRRLDAGAGLCTGAGGHAIRHFLRHTDRSMANLGAIEASVTLRRRWRGRKKAKSRTGRGDDALNCDALCRASPSSHVCQELCAWEYRIERSGSVTQQVVANSCCKSTL